MQGSGETRVGRINFGGAGRSAWRSLALMLGFVVMTAALAGGQNGAAAQSFGWLNFGPVGNDTPGSSLSTNPTDPDFVREWEANPPKGFATLAKANVEATKMAIRIYTMIVANGGWPQLPIPPNKTPRDSLMQVGVTDPGVALLRARLAASRDL